MTSHVGRIYAAATTLFVFFLTWAVIAAKPFGPSAAPAADPRLKALTIREQRLQREGRVVERIVNRRWATYRTQFAKRRSQIASAKQAQLAAAAAPPSVRVVSLPAVTVTRTS